MSFLWTPRCLRVAALMSAIATASALAQEPKPTVESEIARYCAALAPAASEARAAYQLRRLADLEREVRDEVEKLEAKEQAARDWVTRRDAMMNAASDDVVAIYNKMAPDAAATQLESMDESMAAAVLAKMKPQTASGVLAEMQAEKAARLSALIAGARLAERS